MAFRRNYIRKQFSNYLGEERAILDIFVSNEGVIPPSPTPTPSVTPNICYEYVYQNNFQFPSGVAYIDCCDLSIKVIINQPSSTITFCALSIVQTGVNTLISSGTSVTCSAPCPTPTPTPSITPTITPTPNPVCDITYIELATPTPTPTTTTTPTVTPTSTITPTPTPSSGPSIDPDAEAYLNAVVAAGGSVDGTMSAATDTLFTDLKTNGLYSKIDCMYPVIGGTAGSHKFNAIDPQDLNASFRLSFNGSWVHNSSGMTDSGAAFAETYYDASLVVSGADDQHISIYTITQSSRGTQDIGSTITPAPATEVGIYTSFSTNTFIPNVKSADSAYRSYSQPTQQGIGYFIATSTGTNVLGSKNGVVEVNNTQTPAFTNKTHWVGNSNGNQLSASTSLIFATFGRKLTESQMTTMSNIINTFQTTLGRNTYV